MGQDVNFGCGCGYTILVLQIRRGEIEGGLERESAR